jgi:uncharacterized heparinase superfamily protein
MRSLRPLLYGSALYHLALWRPAPRPLDFKLGTPWPGDKERGAALLSGVFSFAGETVQSAGPPWDVERSEAWRAELHGFGWLADLAALGGPTAAKKAQQSSFEWLQRYDIYDRMAWRADVMGDRLFAWLEHFDFIAASERDRSALTASIACQARHLAIVAAREGTGLQRLRALRGLVAACAALGARRQLARALRQLASELHQQILADGGHRGRSPAAQLAAVRCLVDAQTALAAAGLPVPEALAQAIARAGPMLRFFRYGDGRFGLFNGANEGDPAMADLVLARAGAKGRTPATAADTGFERLQAGGTLVLFDCGAPPPPGFDAEAHVGLLAFEMSHNRERIVVNCGAYHGPAAEWRAATRATAAHSTLVVADTNSVELHANGTIGRRPQVTHRRTEQDGNLLVAATHDGYRAGFGLTHERQLFLSADGDDVRGEDSLTGAAGRSFALRFHLHPAAAASLEPPGKSVLIRLAGGDAWRLDADGAVPSLAESIYLGEGIMQKTQQIVLDGHVGTNGATVRWSIRRG